jgi:NADPH2:quinone reductase
MRAVIVEEFGGPEVLKLHQVERPVPGRGEVLLRTLMTSVNFADTKMRRSSYRNRKPPFIPGFDGVGIVEALGEGVSQLQLGQRVAAYMLGGSYADLTLSNETLCYPIPDEVSAVDAAGIGVFITAANALNWAARLARNETVLIQAAAGGVGSSAVQLARLMGAGTIFGTVGSDDKKAVVEELGADVVINYRKESFVERIMEETDGKGVDVVLDTVGGAVLEQSLECLDDFGRVVTFGHSTGEAASITSKPLHRHNRAVIGYSSGGYRKHRPQLLRPTAQFVIDLLEEQRLKLLCGGRFSFEDAAKAHELVENRRSLGKILLSPHPVLSEDLPSS